MPIHEVSISPGEVLNNDQLCEEFRCSPQGGMRKSNTTNTLVIVSNHIVSIYKDKWIDNVLHYTGMGSEGDQGLNFMQNRTLAESNANGVDVHLFEVFRTRQYTYRGRVKLDRDPYQEEQLDAKGNTRNVWMFPLRLEEGGDMTPALPIERDLLEELELHKQGDASKLSDNELEQRASTIRGQAGSRTVESTQYDRSPWVSEYAKRRAGGVCQLCRKPAPFVRANGTPYLETHHIKWLSDGGEDTIKNTVALCPNCHRKMHVVNDSSDVDILRNAIES